MKMNYTRTLSCLTILSVVTTSTMAEEINLGTVEVTTAARVSQNIKNITANASVITSADIEQRGHKTLADALKTIPGIAFSRYGSLNGKTDINVRGFDSTNVLVLIDGVRQNDPASPFGGAHFENITLENIEQVEVIKGAQSGVWGADATGGVINIITKRATENGFNTKINLEYGSFNTSTIGLSTSFKQNAFDGSVNISHIKSDGFSQATAYGKKATEFEDDNYNNKSANLNIGYDIDKNNRIEAFYNISDASGGYDRTINKDGNGKKLKGDAKALAKANNSASTKGAESKTFGVNYKNIFNNITTKVSINRADTDSYFDSDNNLNSNFNYYSYRGITDEANVISSIKYNKEDFVAIGADYRAEDYHRQHKRPKKKDIILNEERKNIGIFLTNSNKFNTLAKDTTIFTQSIRYDDSEVYGGDITYKLGVKHNFSKFNDLWISSNYGTAFKAPSFYQLYSGDYASPDLEPETTKTFDFTVYFSGLEITYFKNKIDNFIVSRRDPKRRINLEGESNMEGVELSYASNIDSIDLAVSFNYTYTDARDSKDVRLLKIPYHGANLMLDYYGIENMFIGTKINFIGKTLQKDYNQPRGKQLTSIASHAIVDINADYDVNEQLQIYARIDNIFDNEKPSILNYGTTQRAYYLGMRYKFN